MNPVVQAMNAFPCLLVDCSVILSPSNSAMSFCAQIDDCQNFPINLIYHTADNEEQEMEVFPQWSQVPMSKMLTFYRKETFALQAVYGMMTKR